MTISDIRKFGVVILTSEPCAFSDGTTNTVDPDQEQSDLGLRYLPRSVGQKT